MIITNVFRDRFHFFNTLKLKAKNVKKYETAVAFPYKNSRILFSLITASLK